VCRPGVTMGSGRPGRASAGEGSVGWREKRNCMPKLYSRSMTLP
jgi:hypothetical protein